LWVISEVIAKFSKFLLFKNFKKIFFKTHCFLNTLAVPFKMHLENLEFYFRKYIGISKFSKILFFENYPVYGMLVF